MGTGETAGHQSLGCLGVCGQGRFSQLVKVFRERWVHRGLKAKSKQAKDQSTGQAHCFLRRGPVGMTGPPIAQ